jgi:hypothetical protein
MGVRPGTFRVRTHRARKAARLAVDHDDDPPARLTRVVLPTLSKGGFE